MKIRSFKGLTPAKGKAEAIASLPYDVVNFEQAEEQAKGRPLSFMRVVRSEIELPAGTDPYSDAVYAHAKENFEKLVADGNLVREPENCMYLYRQQMGDHSQTGLVAVFSAEDYDADVIKKHEKTRQAKENDRYRLTKTLRVNTGPVFLTVKDGTKLDQIVDDKKDSDAAFDFVAADGIRHTGWKISDPAKLAEIVDIFDKIPCAYVADGHHRSASNARCARDLKAANPNHTGKEDYNWFLSVVFPAGQLKILPYNRVVRDLAGMSEAQFLQKLGEVCKVSESGEKSPTAPNYVDMYLGKNGIRSSSKTPSRSGLSKVSTCRFCRNACSPRFLKSATRAPTSASTLSEESGALRSSKGSSIRASSRLRSRCIRRPSPSLWLLPTRAKLCPPRVLGSSRNSARGCLSTRFN